MRDELDFADRDAPLLFINSSARDGASTVLSTLFLGSLAPLLTVADVYYSLLLR